MKIIKIQINFLNSSTIFLGFLLIAHTNSEIFTHLSQCCTSGTKWAETKTHCLDYDYAIENIPRVWRGLCLSTFGMCCSKELRNQHCLAGRLAAKSGTNCELNIKFNSTSYTDCCKACQIGLAVAASGHNCSSNEFSYFVGDESYTNCCNDMSSSSSSSSSDKDTDDNNDNSNNNNNQYQINSNNEGFSDGEDGVILAEDGDICGKVSNLCSQICENTKDSYVCKCYEGYKLDDNLITCSPINDGQTSPLGHLVTNSGEDDDEIDDEDEDIVDDDERNCKRGFVKDEETDECVDIDECMIGTAKCLTDQYCYNTMGNYNCLNIKSTLCQPGYRFNAKTEECEDIDECLENPCSDGSKCNNYAGGYECRKLHHLSLTGTGRDNKLPLLHPSLAHGGNVGGGGGGGGGIPTSARQTYSSIINEQKCDPGYRYKNNKCVDIDECLTDKNACDSNQVCTNEQGGYRCDCKIGFKMDATLNACVDINECQINNHNCLPTQRCDNTIGSYTCIRLQSCGTGYTLNAETGNCDDDDECDLGTHNCPPEYVCRNTMGSFKCDRKRYPPNRVYLNRRTSSSSPSTTSTSTSTSTTTTTTSTTSTPILSTSTTRYTTTTPTPTPSTSTTTTTTSRLPYYPNPSYQSRSYPYTNNPNPYTSSQTNSQLGVDYYPATTHHHRFKLPLEQSNCPYGFQRNQYGACVDINECEIQNACGSHQRCINLNGSYKCQNLLSCPGGYKASNDGTQCIDIDECQTGEHNCGREQTCHNKPGGYVCQCPQGHALNGGRCVDINECEYPNHVCPINANCVNTPGSYYCDCKQGFKKQHSNDKKCDDIDECDEIQGLCEQKCINFWGSYRCACNLGYELNPMDNRTCNDIDECEVHKSYKLCMGFCVNTPGSYECTCPSGYELGTDKMSCRDIDECSQSNVCSGPNEICTNIRGSYRCNTIQCPYGYATDPDQKNRCRTISHTCEGEECYQRPSTYTYNFITLVSNMLIPPHGRTLFTLRGPSWYDNIDFDLKIANVNAPRDVERVTDQHFSTTKIHNQVQLNLMRSIAGPQDIELELSMTVFIGGQPRGKSVAIIYIIVSQYSF